MKNASRVLLVTALPAQCIAQQGFWDPDPFPWGNEGSFRTIAIHLVHTYDYMTDTPKVLSVTHEFYEPTGSSPVWVFHPFAPPDAPPQGLFLNARNHRTYLFCGGASALADGRVLYAGGNFEEDLNIFDATCPEFWNQDAPVGARTTTRQAPAPQARPNPEHPEYGLGARFRTL